MSSPASLCLTPELPQQATQGDGTSIVVTRSGQLYEHGTTRCSNRDSCIADRQSSRLKITGRSTLQIPRPSYGYQITHIPHSVGPRFQTPGLGRVPGLPNQSGDITCMQADEYRGDLYSLRSR